MKKITWQKQYMANDRIRSSFKENGRICNHWKIIEEEKLENVQWGKYTHPDKVRNHRQLKRTDIAHVGNI